MQKESQEGRRGVRNKVVDKFGSVFGELFGTELMATQLERCVYNWTVRTCRGDRIPRYWDNPAFMFRYTTKALALHYNLTHPKNPGLFERVCARDMGLKRLVHASPAELFPALWEPVFERVAHKQLRRLLTVDAETAPDGAFTCRRCKSKKTTFVLLQTRSADEPMTMYCQCLACQSRWKQ